jgi:hypothetical protein
MSNQVYRQVMPSNPCFCGHDIDVHGIARNGHAPACVGCVSVDPNGDAHAFSPDPPIIGTASTLAAQAP